MEPAETKTIGDYRIDIVYDEYADSPRTWDNLTTMICFHRSYNLGDEHEYRSDYFDSWIDLRDTIMKDYKVLCIKPLYMYNHSGITISTTPFPDHYHTVRDSGQIGFVFIDETKSKELNGDIVKDITKLDMWIEGDVKTYDEYLRGDVFGYKVYKMHKDNLGNEEEEFLDGCYGFYGLDYCMGEAEGIVDWYISKEKENDKQTINS